MPSVNHRRDGPAARGAARHPLAPRPHTLLDTSALQRGDKIEPIGYRPTFNFSVIAPNLLGI
jgi:hypothetical protein